MKLIAREPTQEMVDAARYRWLRNEAMAQEIKAPIAVMADHAGRICYHNGLPEWLGGEELDRYIDALIEPSNVWFSDAAPEIQQEPVAFYCGRNQFGSHVFRISNLPITECPLYAFPPDAQAEIAKRDARIEELTDALTDMRGFVSTNTNREMTLKDRFFSAHADFVADNNFDFDAGLLVSGDFVGEEKNEYARMIACTLNDYAKQAAQIEELAAQNQQMVEAIKTAIEHAERKEGETGCALNIGRKNKHETDLQRTDAGDESGGPSSDRPPC